ncbi:unnamed protein product [Closterium sp. NIES-53]
MIKNARDVIFYERLFLRRFREDKQANANHVYANVGHNYASPEDEAAAAILEQDPKGEFTRGDHRDYDNDGDSPRGGASAAGGGGSGSGRGAAPPAPPEPESNDDDVHEVIPQHRHDSTVSGLQLPGLHTATSTAPRVIEPKNPHQARTGPYSKEWREAMDAEIKALESRDTWVLRHGIDFDQTFAPVSHHTSVRILLAIAVAQHLPLCQIDVKNMFLYALVDAVIYVEQPHTYGEGDSCVCQLRKSLYGIKHAPWPWQQSLHNILLEIGFKQLPHDPGMYHRNFCGEYILLTVHIDDLLYTGSSNELLEQFDKSLAGRVDIDCNHDYAEELGKRFNIAPAPLSTPYRTPRPNHKPDNKALSPVGLHTYQQQLGCLLFASVTCRPNLSFIASQLAQYSRKPTAGNLLDLQRALQFFISTPNVGLCYSTIPTSSFNLLGYVDADMPLTPKIDGPGQASSSASSPAAPSPGIHRNRSWFPCHQRKLNSSQQQ